MLLCKCCLLGADQSYNFPCNFLPTADIFFAWGFSYFVILVCCRLVMHIPIGRSIAFLAGIILLSYLGAVCVFIFLFTLITLLHIAVLSDCAVYYLVCYILWCSFKRFYFCLLSCVYIVMFSLEVHYR